MTNIYTGESVRVWESNMAEGQRLRLAMQALTAYQAQADNDIASDLPQTLFDAILKEGGNSS